MADVRVITRVKIFKSQSPTTLENDFNVWANDADNAFKVVEHQIQYSPSLQHFILSTIYTVEE